MTNLRERMILLARVPIGFVLLLGAVSCGGASDAALTTYQDDRGFTVSHPPDWRVDARDDGLIAVESPDSAEFVLVQPFLLTKAEAPDAWLRRIAEIIPDRFAGATVENASLAPGSSTDALARLSFLRGGRAYRGSALCSIADKSGMLYAIAAPADRYDDRRQALVAVLQSVRFVEPKRAAAGAPAMAFDKWTDPVERAYSADVPRGWSTDGGTVRHAAVDVRSSIRSASPDGRAWIFTGDTDLPTFIPPSQMLAAAGLYEGGWYSPGYNVNMLIRRYETGQQFARSYVTSTLQRRCGSPRITATRDRPDASNRLNAFYAQGGLANMQLSTGEVAFTCLDSGGGERRGYVFAGTLATMAGMGSIWNVQYLSGFVAAPDATATAEAALGRLLATFALNPEWARMQQNVTAATSEIVSRTHEAISGIIRDTYEQRWATLDETSRHWSNMTLGLTDVRDPETGASYKVAAGHNYYWRKGDAVVGTTIHERPDIDFSPLVKW
jgi:hypothetical protein